MRKLDAAAGRLRLEYRKDAAWGTRDARRSHVYAELLWKDFFRYLAAAPLALAAEVASAQAVEAEKGQAEPVEWVGSDEWDGSAGAWCMQ